MEEDVDISDVVGAVEVLDWNVDVELACEIDLGVVVLVASVLVEGVAESVVDVVVGLSVLDVARVLVEDAPAVDWNVAEDVDIPFLCFGKVVEREMDVELAGEVASSAVTVVEYLAVPVLVL